MTAIFNLVYDNIRMADSPTQNTDLNNPSSSGFSDLQPPSSPLTPPVTENIPPSEPSGATPPSDQSLPRAHLVEGPVFPPVASENPVPASEPVAPPETVTPPEIAPFPPVAEPPPFETSPQPENLEPPPAVVEPVAPSEPEVAAPFEFSPESQPTVQIPPAAEPVPSAPGGGGFLKKILAVVLGLVVLVVLAFVIMRFLPGLQVKPVTLTYWGLWETDQIIAPIIADYEKTHPRVKIAYSRQSPKQYRERLVSSLARGEGPDIFRFHNTWLPMFSRDLTAVPGELVSSLNFSQNYYPVVSSDLKRGTNYYGIPLEIDGLGLYVNEDIFREAGQTYPSTWEDLRTTAQKLTVRDTDGKIRTAGVALGTTSNVEHWSDILGLMMLQNGVNLSNPTGNLAEDALTYFNLFGLPPDNTWDETLDNSILAFAKGQVAMIFAPSWEAFEIKNINQGLKFKILPMPQLPGTNINWASYWAEGVWQKSKNPKEAFEFLSYLASKEVMTKLFAEESKVRLFGEPYSRVDLGQTLINDQYAGAYIKQAPNAKSYYMSSRTFDNGINDKIIKYYEDAVNALEKGVSPTAALDTAAKGIQQVLSNYGVAYSTASQ